MNALQTRALALALEVNLDTEEGKLLATPKQSVTPELREGIQHNRDELVRDLLIRKSYAFLARHNAERADLSALAPEAFDRVNESYAQSFSDFHEALREWTRQVYVHLKGEAA